MKTIDIIGKNYFGHWTKTRTACRAIVVKDGSILLSYETKTDQWQLPGGGVEAGENEKTCCIRETAEETGVLAEPSECFLEIDEYYEDFKWVNRYFVCRETGTTEMHLTAREKAVGMEPRRIPTEEAMRIFASHPLYDGTDEMRRGMYLREYRALCTLTEMGLLPSAKQTEDDPS